LVDPDGLDTIIRYSGRRAPRRFADDEWYEALEALEAAQPGEIDTIDFYGHGNPEVCIAGQLDLNAPGGYGTGGIRLARNGGVYFWASVPGLPEIVYTKSLQKVLGGKKVRKVRFHSCNAAGGHPDWQKRLENEPKATSVHLPPTEENITRYTSLTLKDTVVQGSLGYYGYHEPNVGNPRYEEPMTYKNGVRQK
jgi:hypothetical protein